MRAHRARGVSVMLAGAAALVLAGGLAAEEFSQEKALEHLKVLAGTIGPRPLGSPQEKEAQAYFAGKMAELGADVEWQPVSGTGRPPGDSSLNTLSHNIIARFPGETPREIVLGAHIDSASPEIPGADDDGSGVAAVLEAARVLSAGQHRATLVFVAFCGEEAGLVGSQSFASVHPLKNVDLMIELDMASGDAPLMLWIDTKECQTPAWLVSAAVEVFHALGYSDLDYPTIFQTLNSAVGGAGSDHEPFLDKGIPAIAFVSDIRFPVHTPFDTLRYFKPDGLARSGRLVVGLVRKFDAGQPAGRTGRYTLVMAGGRPIFIPPPWLAAFAALSLVVGLAGLLRLRARRPDGEERDAEEKIRKSWPKLLCLHFLILLVTFGTFRLMGIVKGRRLPWVYRPGAYVLYAFVFFALGVWLSLQVLRGWRLRKGAFFFGVRAYAFFAVLIVLPWAVSGPRLAACPAAGLLCIGLAWLVRPSWLKGLLWIASPVLMFRLLVLPEYYPFLYREIGSSGLSGIRSGLGFAAVNLGVILFTLVWSEPFLLGLAAVYRSSGGDLFGLKRFRRPIALLPLGLLMLVGGVYLERAPSYSPPWNQSVAVTAKSGGEAGGTSIEFSSGEYLRGIRADLGGRQEALKVRSCFRRLNTPLAMDWLKADASAGLEEKGGGGRVAAARFDFAFSRRPYSVSLRLLSDKPLEIEESNFHFSRRKTSAVLRWIYDPPARLRPELRIGLQAGAGLEAEVTAVFLDMPLPVRCEGEAASFIYRSEIRRRLELVAPRETH